jgi:hypothetical protein
MDVGKKPFPKGEVEWMDVGKKPFPKGEVEWIGVGIEASTGLKGVAHLQ